MRGDFIPDNPILQGMGLVLLGVIASTYVLYPTPVVAITLLYRGESWYRSPEPQHKTAGILLVVGGVCLLGLSSVVYAGLVRTPGFTERAAHLA